MAAVRLQPNPRTASGRERQASLSAGSRAPRRSRRAAVPCPQLAQLPVSDIKEVWRVRHDEDSTAAGCVLESQDFLDLKTASLQQCAAAHASSQPACPRHATRVGAAPPPPKTQRPRFSEQASAATVLAPAQL